MNKISLLYIICSFIAFESAVSILRLNSRALTNILFAMYSITFTIFCLSFSQVVAASSKEVAISWYKISIPSGCITTVLTLHFSISLTGYRKIASNPLLFLPLYLPSLYFIFQLFSDNIISDIANTQWGWDVIYDKNDAGTYLGILHGILLFVAGSIIIFRWYYKAGNVLEKKKARPIAFSYITGAIGCSFVIFNVVSDDPLYNTLLSDIIFALFYTCFILGVRFSVWKYRLMSLHPDVPIIDIIMGIEEACFLTNTTGDIICLNSEGYTLAGENRGKRIHDLFSSPGLIHDDIHAISHSKIDRATIRCFINDSRTMNKTKWFNLEIKCVRDESGALSGFLVMAREDRTLHDFQKQYSITGRQTEIILLIVAGFSNRETGERLGISERTVENHLFNIYNKIGIDNKIELMKTAAKYGVIPE